MGSSCKESLNVKHISYMTETSARCVYRISEHYLVRNHCIAIRISYRQNECVLHDTMF